MPKVKLNTLKQTAYGYAGARVDPTKAGVQKAYNEQRFSKKVMGHQYEEVKAEIAEKTSDPAEMARLMHEYHNERIAELIRTKDDWLDQPDRWPIKANQFNQIFEGNHRVRAMRYLGLDEVEIVFEQMNAALSGFDLPDLWE